MATNRYQHGRYYGVLGRFARRATASSSGGPRPPRPPRATTSPPGAPRVVGSAPQPTTRRRPTPKPKPPPLAPAAAPLPPDPDYEQQIAGYAKTRDDTLSALGTQRHNALLDYGYTATTDAAGNVTGLQFDPSNPYSQAALMLRNYKHRQAANTTTMAARGQLYAGALQTEQDATTGNYNASSDRLQKALLGFLARNQSERTQTRTDYETDVAIAGGQRTQRAQDSPLYDSTVPVAGKKPRKPKKRRKRRHG